MQSIVILIKVDFLGKYAENTTNFTFLQILLNSLISTVRSWIFTLLGANMLLDLDNSILGRQQELKANMLMFSIIKIT